jgi:deoxyribonuclease-1
MGRVLVLPRLVPMLILLLSLTALGADPDAIPSYEETLPTTPSFATAKKRMYAKVYFDHETTFYCGCAYESKVPDLATCGMDTVELGTRAGRTEAEHIVPASAFGRTRPCWAAGGRDECLRKASDVYDPVFSTFHSDLHNLAPTVGEVNAIRSDFTMGLIDGDGEGRFGTCDFEVSFDDDKVEPPMDVRGDIARTYFYVSHTYGMQLTAGELHLFRAWHQADPVSEWEIERDKRIEEQQGNSNPFVR